MASISNFGQQGPYRDYEAEEITLQALSSRTGKARPTKYDRIIGWFAEGHTKWLGNQDSNLLRPDLVPRLRELLTKCLSRQP